MKLNELSVTEYKGFENQTLYFNGQNTVIFGINGVGKSSVLYAINYLFWPWLNRINRVQGISFQSFDASVVKNGASKMDMLAKIEIDGTIFQLSKSYNKRHFGRTAYTESNKKEYDTFLEYFNKNYLSNSHPMPIFVFYGTNRSVLDIPLRIRKKHDFSILASIEKASENNLNFRTFFEWFRNQEDYENEKKLDDPRYEDVQLKCVRFALTAMLDDVHDLRVKRNPLRMTVKKGNEEFEVNQLSDGEKCTLALFGDLARRISLANQDLENPLYGKGIVLIDEIELHMHPSWERKILIKLREVFPNIQFIVTTHSPQVLNSVNEDFKIIKLLFDNENNTIAQEIDKLDGLDSNCILEEYMNTSSKNPIFKAKINEAFEAIHSNEFEKAEQIYNAISSIYGKDNVDAIEIEGAIRRGKYIYEKNK